MARRSAYLLPLAAGLALLPAAARADLRIEERSTSLDSSATRWTFIKGDKRSIVTKAEVKGVLYDAGAKYGAYVEIARPDRELIWEIDPQERSYREVTFQQFSKLLQKGVQAPRNANEQPLRTLYRSETTSVHVEPTGKTRRIAGLDAEQVIARVVVGATNLVSGRQFIFTFDQEIWLTKNEQLLAEVQGFEQAYVETFGSAASLQQAQLLAGSWSDAFVTHLRAVNDRVRALKGFPLAVTTTVTEQAVAQEKGEKSSSRKFTVNTSEVRRVSFDTLPDSEFELPVGYINADTKVAVARPLPVPEGAIPPAPQSPATVMPEPAPAPAPGTVVAAAPMKEPTPPAAVKPEGTTPEPAPAKPPVVTAVPRIAPGTPVVSAPPSNVVVKGAPPRTPQPPSTAPTPTVVARNDGPDEGVYDSPVLQYLLAVPTQAGPQVFTVEEPEIPKKRKKRRSIGL